MAVKKRDESKVVARNVNHTNLDVRLVHKKEGYGKQRKIVKSWYGIFTTKHQVKDGFKSSNEAIAFIEDNIHKYDRKTRKFK